MLDPTTVLAPVQAETEVSIAEAGQISAYVAGIVVNDHPSCQHAADVDGLIAEEIKALEAKKDEWCKPLNKVVRSISAEFKKAIQPREHARSVLKAKIKAHLDAERQRQAEALATARTQEEVVHAVALLAPAPVGVTERVEYRGEVVDERQLPREFWVIDQAKIDRVMRESKGSATIPGVRVVVDTQVVRRA